MRGIHRWLLPFAALALYACDPGQYAEANSSQEVPQDINTSGGTNPEPIQPNYCAQLYERLKDFQDNQTEGSFISISGELVLIHPSRIRELVEDLEKPTEAQLLECQKRLEELAE